VRGGVSVQGAVIEPRCDAEAPRGPGLLSASLCRLRVVVKAKWLAFARRREETAHFFPVARRITLLSFMQTAKNFYF